MSFRDLGGFAGRALHHAARTFTFPV